MLFSSLLFLYLFLPITLLGYYLLPIRFKNYWLLLTSLIFFAWGGVSLTIILLISILLNYLFGLILYKNIDSPQASRVLFAGVGINLLILVIFKYGNFIIENLNTLFTTLNLPPIPQSDIVLPIGISFYTFHSLSYLVDIYRRKTPAQTNILDLSLYICMFSQLIAGPIIRYSDVWQQLRSRTHSLTKFASGVERFLIGLGKKVLLANTFARVADQSFAAGINDLDGLNAWLGIICYTLQIYCDFAGYSDMAIGLGRMFGFEFMENFDFPYTAKSVKEFWRKWHISLSTFFRDYVYIPLGGNRLGTARSYFNLVFVFFVTGFWHGASWSFVVWGLFHGFFMLLERLGFENILKKMWSPLANLYTLLVVLFAWVLFRADTLNMALDYWAALFRWNTTPEQFGKFMGSMNKELLCALIVALLGSFGLFQKIYNSIEKILVSPKPLHIGFSYVFHLSSIFLYLFILVTCTLYLVAGTYNPFIYYRF